MVLVQVQATVRVGVAVAVTILLTKGHQAVNPSLGQATTHQDRPHLSKDTVPATHRLPSIKACMVVEAVALPPILANHINLA